MTIAGGNFEEGDKVAVIGGTLDSTGIIDTHVTICSIITVGELDLLVKLDRSSSSSTQIVPKSICVPIRIESSSLSHRTLVPQLGDMVHYFGKLNWRDTEPTTLVGTVYEIKYREGAPSTARVHAAGEMIDLPCGDLMVLQRKPSPS